ncbi:MAG: (2Fe-2S)-binding protein [Thaumarchaeota archaeon]|nr:(2Fe-2S)-binding protein [Nitrososphaerota archaeon]
MIEITLKVNGQMHRVSVEPGENLLRTLREKIGTRGVKQSCDYGGCGACTVIANGKTVYSCMTLSAKMSDAEITTVEGLETTHGLDPLQTLFMEKWALQCGFCTPGILLSSKCLLDSNPNPSEGEIKEALAGHVCRCTGYIKIIEAVREAAELRSRK